MSAAPLRSMVLLLSLASFAVAQVSPADAELTRYLESRGLHRPLIDHLDALLAGAASSEKSELAERLAGLLAVAIEHAPTTALRDEYEQRARSLLDALPEEESMDLRLALARASYARAEDSAERWRLRLVEPALAEDASRALTAVLADLTRLAAAANRRVDALERQEENARAGDSTVLTEALAAARRQRSQANFLAGWAGVYLAELAPQRAGVLATDAAKRFGWLLNAPQGEWPPLDRLPESTLRLEHVARAAMGVGVSASLRDDYVLAVRWFDLLDRIAEVPQAVRDQVFARRVAAAARAGEWTDLLRLVQVARGVETPTGARRDVAPTRLDPATARLLAVLAFEPMKPPRSPAVVQSLRTLAIGDLVARNELAHVADLTARYGTEPLGQDGFIPLYIRGLQAYHAARDLHTSRSKDPEQPSADAEVLTLYRRAAELLKGALDDRSGEGLVAARADAALMLAGTVFYSAASPADANEAADRFERAFALADSPARDADARWMLIRALDLAIKTPAAARAGPQRDAVARREAAVAEFLRRFPDDHRATLLILEQSSKGAIAPEQAAQALLAVSRDSPAWPAARREAARILYTQARAAAPPDRPLLVARFAALADGIFADEARDARAGDSKAVERALLLARQLLDLLLTDPPDAPRAARTLDALIALVPETALELVRAELLFRRVQIADAVNDTVEARRAADALRLRKEPGSPAFARAADQLLLRRALSAFRAQPTESDARDVMQYVALLLPKDQSADPASLTMLLVSAEAGQWLWQRHNDASARDAALQAVRAALAIEPSSHAALLRQAVLAEAASLPAEATQAWIAMLAASEVGSERWFEATANVIRILETHDAPQARERLRRHRALFPKLGPPPWNEVLAQIAARLEEGEPAR